MIHVMDNINSLPRSPEMMSVGDTALLVIDVQERMMPAISGNERIVWNVRRLVDAAKILGIEVVGTEQYPNGLGSTVDQIAERLHQLPTKMTFSSGSCLEIFRHLEAQKIHRILLCGVEAHVCIQQTALDLLASGWRVYIAVDAVGSRFEIDYRTALGRMDSAGATLTTTESAMFEWCQTAKSSSFKQISQLAKEPGPQP